MSARRGALWALVALLVAGCAVLCALHARPASPATVALPPARSQAVIHPTPEPPRGTVAVNRGDADELRLLYGIGDTLAEAILAERERGGAFYLPEDLLSVRGIGPKKLAAFRWQLDLQP